MQFLKTLFWIVLALVLVLFASVNWNNVTVELWGGLEVDIKLPLLILIAFLVGFLPTFILYRARLWSLKRRIETERQSALAQSAPVAASVGPAPAPAASEPAANAP